MLGLGACSSDPEPDPAGLSVTWGDSPACTYDAATGSVTAELVASGSGAALATVTAHADGVGGVLVGSGSVEVDSTGPVTLTFDTTRAPYVDIDGVAACSIEVSPRGPV